MTIQNQIKNVIRDIPNYPKKGILFKDITPLFLNPKLYQESIEAMAKPFINQNIDVVIGAEARGFLFAPGIAKILNASFMPIRKPNKLPGKIYSVEYALEYGTDILCIHQNQMPLSSRVLLVDDVLATGGTMETGTKLTKKAGGIVVGYSFLIELKFLKGHTRLNNEIASVLTY